jgi:hypothetical protein
MIVILYSAIPYGNYTIKFPFIDLPVSESNYIRGLMLTALLYLAVRYYQSLLTQDFMGATREEFRKRRLNCLKALGLKELFIPNNEPSLSVGAFYITRVTVDDYDPSIPPLNRYNRPTYRDVREQLKAGSYIVTVKSDNVYINRLRDITQYWLRYNIAAILLVARFILTDVSALNYWMPIFLVLAAFSELLGLHLLNSFWSWLGEALPGGNQCSVGNAEIASSLEQFSSAAACRSTA